MKQKPTVALITSSEGHFSLSEAIRQTLEPRYHVVTLELPILMHWGYKALYRFVPALFAVPYLLSRSSYLRGFLKFLYAQTKYSTVARFLTETKADYCITTYFMALDLLERYQRERRLPFLNIVAHPYSIHPIELSPLADLNVLFDQTGLKAVQELNFQSPTSVWGWFVQPKFEQPVNRSALYSKHGLDPKKVTVVLTGGSEGSQKILTLLPFLLTHPKPLNVVIVNGSNALLKQQLDRLIARTAHSNKTVLNVGFTTELHEYLQLADMTVGKAGPNTIFEAVATTTPFLATTHIWGQEDGNLQLIEDYDIGAVAEEVEKAKAVLDDWLSEPTKLLAFDPKLQKLAAYNKQSKAKLLAFFKTVLPA